MAEFHLAASVPRPWCCSLSWLTETHLCNFLQSAVKNGISHQLTVAFFHCCEWFYKYTLWKSTQPETNTSGVAESAGFNCSLWCWSVVLCYAEVFLLFCPSQLHHRAKLRGSIKLNQHFPKTLSNKNWTLKPSWGSGFTARLMSETAVVWVCCT